MKHLRGQQCLFTKTRIESEVSLLLLVDLTVSANTLSSNKYSNNNIFFFLAHFPIPLDFYTRFLTAVNYLQ